jgi:cytochrome c biogenesis protein CcmG/thiol:disulfide interchange protein DsbE
VPRTIRWLAGILLLLAACSDGAGFSFARVSGRMPVVAGPTLDGGAHTPAAYRGKVVVVNFWNPDCSPCRREEPILEASWRRLHDQGVLVIGLMYVGGQWPNDPGAARAFVRRFGVTYPTLVDGDSSLARAFGIAGIPSTIVVDAKGRLRLRVLGGMQSGEMEALVKMVQG